MKLYLLLFTAIATPGVLMGQAESSPAGTNPVSAITVDPGATNTAIAPAPLLDEAATHIFSDRASFDLKSRVATYTGNVRVVDPQMKLTCEVLTATVPESGRVNHIVATGNVVINAKDKQGKTVHATSDKAVYVYKVENAVTNETIELTGNPFVQSDTISGTGEPIIWNRIDNTFHGSNLHMVFRPGDGDRTRSEAGSTVTETNRP